MEILEFIYYSFFIKLALVVLPTWFFFSDIIIEKFQFFLHVNTLLKPIVFLSNVLITPNEEKPSISVYVFFWDIKDTGCLCRNFPDINKKLLWSNKSCQNMYYPQNRLRFTNNLIGCEYFFSRHISSSFQEFYQNSLTHKH